MVHETKKTRSLKLENSRILLLKLSVLRFCHLEFVVLTQHL